MYLPMAAVPHSLEGDGRSTVKCNTIRRFRTCPSCVNNNLCPKAMALITTSLVRPDINGGGGWSEQARRITILGSLYVPRDLQRQG
jgi:hypothetical protein